MSVLAWPRVLFGNPLIQKGRRSRLRGGVFFAWSLVVVSITAFLCLIVYLSITNRYNAPSQDAAAAMIIPIIIVQGVLLMLLGTGAVASGLAIEREHGLLEYARMTPMSPTAKIIGYLFGLPAREYVLFALTLPFLIWAVAWSEVSTLTILHFYLVFFTSVLVYHMTGMVAGMASSKPRMAAIVTQGMVLFLYLVLPQLSHFGLTYFEFLTIRPTLFGMIQSEIELHHPNVYTSGFVERASYDNVPLFNRQLHPTIYTLLVQGSLLAVMWIVTYRKWRNEFSHALSKAEGLIVFAGAMFFFIGSLWQIFGAEAYERIFEGRQLVIVELPPIGVLGSILSLMIAISGSMALLIFLFTTPTKHTIIKGWSKARKLGHRRLPIDSDEATGAPLAVMFSLITFAGCGALTWRAIESERFFIDAGPAWTWLALVGLFLGCSLFAQGLLERLGILRFFMVIFVLWALPLLAAMIIMAGWEAPIAAGYTACPSPPLAAGMAVTNVLANVVPLDPGDNIGDEELSPHLPALVLIPTIGYLVLGALVQAELIRWRRRIKRESKSAEVLDAA